MKTACAATFLLLLLGHCASAQNSFPAAEGSLGGTNRLDFVLRPVDDFRLLFCDADELAQLLKRGVSLVHLAGPGTKTLEVSVDGQIIIPELLKELAARDIWSPLFSDWKGQPAVTVVTRHAILRISPTKEGLYLYAHNDPVNLIDPSGNFTSGQALGTLAVVGLLTIIAINIRTTRNGVSTDR